MPTLEGCWLALRVVSFKNEQEIGASEPLPLLFPSLFKLFRVLFLVRNNTELDSGGGQSGPGRVSVVMQGEPLWLNRRSQRQRHLGREGSALENNQVDRQAPTNSFLSTSCLHILLCDVKERVGSGHSQTFFPAVFQ